MVDKCYQLIGASEISFSRARLDIAAITSKSVMYILPLAFLVIITLSLLLKILFALSEIAKKESQSFFGKSILSGSF